MYEFWNLQIVQPNQWFDRKASNLQIDSQSVVFTMQTAQSADHATWIAQSIYRSYQANETICRQHSVVHLTTLCPSHPVDLHTLYMAPNQLPHYKTQQQEHLTLAMLSRLQIVHYLQIFLFEFHNLHIVPSPFLSADVQRILQACFAPICRFAAVLLIYRLDLMICRLCKFEDRTEWPHARVIFNNESNIYGDIYLAMYMHQQIFCSVFSALFNLKAGLFCNSW